MNKKNNCKIEQIKSFDGTQIHTQFWESKNAKAVIVVIHGMVEYVNRYDYFANACVKQNLSVFGFDLRAHGNNAGSPENVGVYEGDLFEDSVKDVMFFADLMHQKCGLPVIFLGHSYGSFVLQEVVQRYQNYALAIFSGSANLKGDASVSMGKIVAKITRFFKGKKAPAKMIYKLSFGAYGKNFENKNWLTSDEKIFEKYVQDPFCGNVCCAQFYVSFFTHLSKLYNKNNLAKISKKSPVLITSGEHDPVGGKNHKLVDKLDLLYRGLGLDVSYKIWPKCRHEILNEKNRDEIINYIIDFCNKKIKD